MFRSRFSRKKKKYVFYIINAWAFEFFYIQIFLLFSSFVSAVVIFFAYLAQNTIKKSEWKKNRVFMKYSFRLIAVDVIKYSP